VHVVTPSANPWHARHTPSHPTMSAWGAARGRPGAARCRSRSVLRPSLRYGTTPPRVVTVLSFCARLEAGVEQVPGDGRSPVPRDPSLRGNVIEIRYPIAQAFDIRESPDFFSVLRRRRRGRRRQADETSRAAPAAARERAGRARAAPTAPGLINPPLTTYVMLTRYYAIGLVNTNTSLIHSTALLNGGTHGFAAYHTAYLLLF